MIKSYIIALDEGEVILLSFAPMITNMNLIVAHPSFFIDIKAISFFLFLFDLDSLLQTIIVLFLKLFA